ncbi:MAG: acetate--CoA ligase family protein [Armatimonadota bacterium]|nr:MAG: acetate--CoA ligase family protein [Armatimonadota bacterium]
MLEHFFQPNSVAVIGASTDPAKVGHAVFRNMISSGFRGVVYPINPNAESLLGHECYPSVAEVPSDVDMAVIVVPAKFVPAVMRQCGEKGIDSVIIISAGFKETGPEGAQLEREVGGIAREHGIRVLGPNCLGLITPRFGVNASFAPGMPQAGNVSLMSQSGALATAILDWALEQGVGFSKFVSFGNGVDVETLELLRAWKDDEDTSVIVAYIEGLRDGAEFMRIAREVTAVKPVIILKSGGTAAGARAVSSHTGSLAGSEQAYDAAFRQTGVIRAHSISELFDYALAFAYQPLPEGPAMAIVTNAGGPGIMATDACERSGILHLASPEKATVERLREKLPPASNFYNPIDVLGDADAARYRFAMESVLADANVNAVVPLLAPQAMTEVEHTARAIYEAAAADAKPVLACMMGGHRMRAGDRLLDEHRIPSYAYPEQAVGALAAMVRYRQWLGEPAPEAVEFAADRSKVKQVFDAVRAQSRVNLGEVEAREVLSAYGFRVPEARLAHSAEDAVQMAEEIGYPVVMKISSPDILHKSDIGAVRVNISGPEQVADTFDLIMLRAQRYMASAQLRGVLVQEMIRGGKEVILGASRDPQFGSRILFGLGGIYVEVLKDVAFRVAPVDRRHARGMLEEIRASALLGGVRGERPADTDAIVEALLRLSQLTLDYPEILEMDINPLAALEPGRGVVAIDSRITIAEQEGGSAAHGG